MERCVNGSQARVVYLREVALVLLVCVSQRSMCDGLVPRVAVMRGAVDSQKVEKYPRGHWQTLWVHSLMASWICEMRLDLHRGLWPSVTLDRSLGKQDHPVLYLSLRVYGFGASCLRLGNLRRDFSLDGTVVIVCSSSSRWRPCEICPYPR